MRPLAGLLLLLALSPAVAQDVDHFAPQRLALIPAEERDAWDAYLQLSALHAERDFEIIEAELVGLGRQEWTPAPKSRSRLFHDETTGDWFAGAEARRIAEILLSYQTPSGGWAKNVDFRRRPRQPGQSFFSGQSWTYIGTFDNDATTEQMRFLGKAYQAQGDARFKEAFLRGLGYIFDAQFPNGCWPQVYPLQGGYHDAATFNDEAIPNILHLLRRIGEGDFDFVPQVLKRRAGTAMWRGVDCVLNAQVTVGDRLTVWAQQHDPISLEPAQGRPYEHPVLTAGESVDVVLFLMELDAPSPRVVDAVRSAVQWFEEVALDDFEYEHPTLRQRDGAGPVWARFYEPATNRPIFSNRDGIVLYSWDELDDERRRGYAWYRYGPATVLRRFESWSRRHAP